MSEAAENPALDTRFFRDVFNASPIGIVVENLDGQPLFVNPAFCSFLGFSEEELRGKHCVDFSPPEDAERDWVLFQQLRTGSIDHYQLEKRYFRRDRSLVWGRLSISLLKARPSPLVIAMVEDITDKKTGQQALRESEQRFRLAAQAGKMYSFEWDVMTDVVQRSAEHVEVLGVTGPLRLTRQQFVEKIHPDDRARFIASIAGLTPESPIAEVTYRVLVSHADTVWLKSSGRGFFDEQGKLVRLIGMVADISDLKRAEDAASAMTRTLIKAQEQERSRIGRELHDDIGQQLAMLAIEIEQLPENPSGMESRVQELRTRITEIANNVQAISHDLHSSKLEYLGVVAGMKSWCKDFAERHKMEIDFESDVYSVLPLEVGLPLFRVLQEGLHNASKHSGVRRVEVKLRAQAREIDLVVSDLGRGFDVEAEMKGKGLGLTSMLERIRLVNGTITIDSKPMGGTTIYVHVPFKSEEFSQRAVG